MNDLAIDYFLIVARNKSFSKTARELFISQPAISRQISALEHELGFTLFDRTNKQTTLTEIGELYYRLFVEYKESLIRTRQAASEINARLKGQVTLGCLSGWDLSAFIPKMVDSFFGHFPNITVSVVNHSFGDLTGALMRGELDCILSIESSLGNLKEVSIQPLIRVPMVILYSTNHRLGRKSNPVPEDFRDETFLVPTDREMMTAQESVKASMIAYGFTPKMKIVPNIESMLSGVQNGLGVAISDLWSRERSNKAFRSVLLDTQHVICLAWSKANRNSAIPAFVNEITRLFADEKPETIAP